MQNLIRQQGCISRNPEEPGRCKTMSVNHAKRFGPMKNDIRQQQYRHDLSAAANASEKSFFTEAASFLHQQKQHQFQQQQFINSIYTADSTGRFLHQQQQHQFQQQQQFINSTAVSTIKLTACISSNCINFSSSSSSGQQLPR